MDERRYATVEFSTPYLDELIEGIRLLADTGKEKRGIYFPLKETVIDIIADTLISKIEEAIFSASIGFEEEEEGEEDER